MDTILTPEQSQALAENAGRPLRVFDPHTQRACVLLPVEAFERLRTAALCDDSDFDPREAYPLIDRIMADDDALDPYLHLYQRDDRKGPP